MGQVPAELKQSQAIYAAPDVAMHRAAIASAQQTRELAMNRLAITTLIPASLPENSGTPQQQVEVSSRIGRSNRSSLAGSWVGLLGWIWRNIP